MLQWLNAPLRKVPVWLVYGVGLIPGVYVYWAGFNNRLGADPLAVIEHETGIWALRFMIAALFVSPLLRLLRLNLVKFRRSLGLLGFYYAAMHLAAWVWLDRGFSWPAIWTEILKRPYITVGMVAFVILVPLAVTSNDWAVRRLATATWRRIHWWAYIATALGAIHFLLVVKAWPPEPLIYCAIVAVLLMRRVWKGVAHPKTAVQA